LGSNNTPEVLLYGYIIYYYAPYPAIAVLGAKNMIKTKLPEVYDYGE